VSIVLALVALLLGGFLLARVVPSLTREAASVALLTVILAGIATLVLAMRFYSAGTAYTDAGDIADVDGNQRFDILLDGLAQGLFEAGVLFGLAALLALLAARRAGTAPQG